MEIEEFFQEALIFDIRRFEFFAAEWSVWRLCAGDAGARLTPRVVTAGAVPGLALLSLWL